LEVPPAAVRAVVATHAEASGGAGSGSDGDGRAPGGGRGDATHDDDAEDDREEKNPSDGHASRRPPPPRHPPAALAQALAALEASYDAVLAASRPLLEGLRGAFSLLVLYDHFHHPAAAVSDAVIVDTYLFVLVSGFATALQTREAPPPPPPPAADGTMTPSRRPFALARFLATRAAGLLPTLWLALLLNVPPWHVQATQGIGTPTSRATCTVLYAVGMQSWYRPACHEYGPNNLLYVPSSASSALRRNGPCFSLLSPLFVVTLCCRSRIADVSPHVPSAH
jgi:hypothetical protein